MFVNPQAAGGVWNFSAIVPVNVYLIFVMIIKGALWDAAHDIIK